MQTDWVVLIPTSFHYSNPIVNSLNYWMWHSPSLITRCRWLINNEEINQWRPPLLCKSPARFIYILCLVVKWNSGHDRAHRPHGDHTIVHESHALCCCLFISYGRWCVAAFSARTDPRADPPISVNRPCNGRHPTRQPPSTHLATRGNWRNWPRGNHCGNRHSDRRQASLQLGAAEAAAPGGNRPSD